MLPSLLLILSAPTHAMQLAVDRPTLCTMADTVVVAEVTSVETRWAEGAEGGIERVVWLAVDRVVKGDPADTLRVVLPGGTIGELTHVVEDVPPLTPDQSYLLMLEAGTPIGGEQSAVAVRQFSDQRGQSVGAAVRALGSCQ